MCGLGVEIEITAFPPKKLAGEESYECVEYGIILVQHSCSTTKAKRFTSTVRLGHNNFPQPKRQRERERARAGLEALER